MMRRDERDVPQAAKRIPCSICGEPALACDVWGFSLCPYDLARWYAEKRFRGNDDHNRLRQLTAEWLAEMKREVGT